MEIMENDGTYIIVNKLMTNTYYVTVSSWWNSIVMSIMKTI